MQGSNQFPSRKIGTQSPEEEGLLQIVDEKIEENASNPSLPVLGPLTVNNLIYQTHTSSLTDVVQDAFYSHFDSATDGYNVHAIRDGAGGGGALGGANTGTGLGSAIVGNRYGAGEGDGGNFVRTGTGAGYAVQANQNSTGIGDAIVGVKSGVSNGHGVYGLFSGTGTGNGVQGLVSTNTTGNGVYGEIVGGGSGDAIKGKVTTGTGYAGNFLGGKGVRVERNPVLDAGLNDVIVVGSTIGGADAYSLHFQNYFDGGGIGQIITKYVAGVATQSIDFGHTTIKISSTKGVELPKMTKAERDAIPTPAQGTEVFVTDNGGYKSYYNGGWFKVTAAAD